MARTPFTVSYSCMVLYSHRTSPSPVEYARRVPSLAPANTTPGMTVAAPNSPELHQVASGSEQFVGVACVVDQTRSPVAGRSATIAPVPSESQWRNPELLPDPDDEQNARGL